MLLHIFCFTNILIRFLNGVFKNIKPPHLLTILFIILLLFLKHLFFLFGGLQIKQVDGQDRNQIDNPVLENERKPGNQKHVRQVLWVPGKRIDSFIHHNPRFEIFFAVLHIAYFLSVIIGAIQKNLAKTKNKSPTILRIGLFPFQ